jgi:RimJ/RimL family protein N-acetyltransferase
LVLRRFAPREPDGRPARPKLARYHGEPAGQLGIRILENKLIVLHQFNEIDFSKLIAEIPDARFLLQWAGPKYTYPLDAAQLSDTLTKTIEEKPSFQVFKAIKSDTSETVGHIQLMDIDYNSASCVLGRVIIFQKHRGNGFGKSMVHTAVNFAFENLHLAEVTLGVFDFNTPAIQTYKSIGFAEFQYNKGARQFQNESWNVIKMKLSKNIWLHQDAANHSPQLTAQTTHCN